VRLGGITSVRMEEVTGKSPVSDSWQLSDYNVTNGPLNMDTKRIANNHRLLLAVRSPSLRKYGKTK